MTTNPSVKDDLSRMCPEVVGSVTLDLLAKSVRDRRLQQHSTNSRKSAERRNSHNRFMPHANSPTSFRLPPHLPSSVRFRSGHTHLVHRVNEGGANR